MDEPKGDYYLTLDELYSTLYVGMIVQLKELNHDNVTMFIGACTEPEHVCYAMQFCSRGTVQVRHFTLLHKHQ